MADVPTIHVDIVSAEGEIFSGPATMVFAPASEGDVGIAPRHAPLLSLLKAGEVRVKTPDGEEQHFFVGGGSLEVQPTRVTVLADTALRARDIDEAAALAAKQRPALGTQEQPERRPRAPCPATRVATALRAQLRSAAHAARSQSRGLGRAR